MEELEKNFRNTLATCYCIDDSPNDLGFSCRSFTTTEIGMVKFKDGKALFRKQGKPHDYEYEVQEIDEDKMGFKYSKGMLLFHFRVHPDINRIPWGGDVKYITDSKLREKITTEGVPFKFEYMEYDDVTYYYYDGKIYEKLFYIGE